MREQQFSAFLDKTRRLKHVLVGRGHSPELANLREASTRVAHAGAVVAAARGVPASAESWYCGAGPAAVVAAPPLPLPSRARHPSHHKTMTADEGRRHR